MYFPYMRGKQYELITIREQATLIAEGGFPPIITPVREQIRGLQKTLAAMQEANGRVVVIVNPEHGDLTDNPTAILELLNSDEFENYDGFIAGIRLDADISAAEVMELCGDCLLYTSPSPRDRTRSRMPSSA